MAMRPGSWVMASGGGSGREEVMLMNSKSSPAPVNLRSGGDLDRGSFPAKRAAAGTYEGTDLKLRVPMGLSCRC
jgi:hypothetical protein